MNKDQLLKHFDETTTRMRALLASKNHDYAGAGGEVDAFANFTRVEALGIASTEVGFLTRMTDKLCRIVTFVKGGVLLVDDEKVADTLLDLANYSILMAGYIKSRKELVAAAGQEVNYSYSVKPKSKVKPRGNK